MNDIFLNALIVVLLALPWAVPLCFKILRKRLERIKGAYATDERSVPNIRVLLKRHKPKRWIVSNCEKSFYNSLADPVTLFRGGSQLEASSKYGISWTTRRGVAEHYAFRYGMGERAVFKTVVPKSTIRAVLLPNTISECLILSPANVEVVTTKPTRFFWEHQRLRRRLELCEQSLRDGVKNEIKNFLGHTPIYKKR